VYIERITEGKGFVGRIGKGHASPGIKREDRIRSQTVDSSLDQKRCFGTGSQQPHLRRPCLTSVKLQATLFLVKIRNIVHKGLKRLYADDSAKGAPDTVDKLRKMLAFLDDMQDPEELRALPSWKVHTLTGDRKGTWSLSVTRNRRLTFRIDAAEDEICDLNLDDYH
jgi:proteic killer suppression protein